MLSLFFGFSFNLEMDKLSDCTELQKFHPTLKIQFYHLPDSISTPDFHRKLKFEKKNSSLCKHLIDKHNTRNITDVRFEGLQAAHIPALQPMAEDSPLQIHVFSAQIKHISYTMFVR